MNITHKEKIDIWKDFWKKKDIEIKESTDQELIEWHSMLLDSISDHELKFPFMKESDYYDDLNIMLKTKMKIENTLDSKGYKKGA